MARLTQTDRSTLDGLRTDLSGAASDVDRAKRLLRIVAVITRALQVVGITPVLVGGGAVEFYTSSEYQTEDIDLVGPSGADVNEVMTKLGFDQLGKDFHHRVLDLFVEFPSSTLQPGEQVSRITVEGVGVSVISPADLILDRLRAFVYWRSLRDGLNVLSLLQSGVAIDESRVDGLARSEGLQTAWDDLRALQRGERVDRDADRLERELRKILDAVRH